MPLTLKILAFKGQAVSQNTVVTIGDAGGTIGRSSTNTLMLDDPERFVSRQHASISMKNGLYYITDSSLSGVVIAGYEQPLHNSSQQIVDGTLLKIGEYDIAVNIIDAAEMDDFPFAQPSNIASASLFDNADYDVADDMLHNSLLSDDGATFVSHEELIQNDEPFQPRFESKLQGNASPLFDNYNAPHVTTTRSAVDEIPENFSFEDLLADTAPVHDYSAQTPVDDAFTAALHAAAIDVEIEANDKYAKQLDKDAEQLTDELEPATAFALFADTDDTSTTPVNDVAPVVATVPISTPSPAVNPNVNSDLVFDAFLQGIGIDYTAARPKHLDETMLRVGRMFRKLVDGTVALLRSRAEFKSVLRVNVTVIKATDNNPLKFTVSSEDVLRQLLENKSNGFLDSVSAIDEGFTDIMNHQLAMQAGIQAALADVLKQFEPRLIEKQFEQGLVLQKKSKCWDKFSETYHSTVDDALDNFFGDAFVQAYEAQMQALKRHQK